LGAEVALDDEVLAAGAGLLAPGTNGAAMGFIDWASSPAGFVDDAPLAGPCGELDGLRFASAPPCAAYAACAYAGLCNA